MDVGKVECLETARLKSTLEKNGIRCMQDHTGKMKMWFRINTPVQKTPPGRVIFADFAEKQ